MQPGTYFYHGHYGMQRSAGLYGSLIVDVPEGEKEPFQYDGEFELLLSDLDGFEFHSNSGGSEIRSFQIFKFQIPQSTYRFLMSRGSERRRGNKSPSSKYNRVSKKYF